MAQSLLTPPVLPNLSAAPSSPTAGTIYFDTDDDTPYIYNGASWVAMSAAAAPAPRVTVASTFYEVLNRGTGGTGGTGSRTLSSSGVNFGTGASAAGFAYHNVGAGRPWMLSRNPVHTWNMGVTTYGTEVDIVVAMGSSSQMVNGTGSLLTANHHMGFLIERRASVTSIYAVNGNGSSQTKTAMASGVPDLTTDMGLLSVRYDGTSLRFYVNGVLIATHTTNLPTEANLTTACLGVSNRAVASATTFVIRHYAGTQDAY